MNTHAPSTATFAEERSTIHIDERADVPVGGHSPMVRPSYPTTEVGGPVGHAAGATVQAGRTTEEVIAFGGILDPTSGDSH